MIFQFVRFCVASLFIAVAVCVPASADDKDGFRPLFDGKSLDGWVQRGGKAKYSVENGEIVGTSVLGTPNSFLCTDRDYGDFILELELKADPTLNSGVQFRSQCFDVEKTFDLNGKPKKIDAGRVHGYQAEVDSSDRAWSGGVYDEGRRGWLFDLKGKKESQQAFKKDAWNKYRIECRGDSIKTFVNGVPCADLKDAMTPAGFIALQVHSTKEETPREVRWRNIQIKELK